MLKSKSTRINEFHGPVIPEPVREANESFQIISEALKQIAVSTETVADKDDNPAFILFKLKKSSRKKV